MTEYARPLLLSEIVGNQGVFHALSDLRNSQPLPKDTVLDYLKKHRVATVSEIFDALLAEGVFGQLAENYFLSSVGQRLWLLLSAINGADLMSVVNQLAQINPALRPYDLVTEGMTASFINDLENRPDFRRIYICSPWVNLREKSKRRLMYALYKAQTIQGADSRIEIIVIARPLQKDHAGYEAFKETFSLLRRLGADIVVNPSVHAKLYIREPGPQGGLTVAIVGSENLTGSRNIELGIRITNDNSIIRKLISYYFEIYARCKPIQLER